MVLLGHCLSGLLWTRYTDQWGEGGVVLKLANKPHQNHSDLDYISLKNPFEICFLSGNSSKGLLLFIYFNFNNTDALMAQKKKK